jgi:hypothetical protein
MHSARRVICALGLFVVLLGTLIGGQSVAHAQAPERKTTIIVPYTEYEWWLINWSDNTVRCRVLTSHDGLPTLDEVGAYCGQDLVDEWQSTELCNPAKIAKCTGVYLFLASTTPKEKEVVVELPPAVVLVSLEGCDPLPPANLCTALPTLVLTGEEPLPNQSILNIQGTYDGEPFYCDGSVCKIPLRITPVLGSTIEFWADSSYGDSSEHFTAQVRVIDTGVSPEPNGGGWYVDVASSQWQGAPLASCARIWEAFPPIGEPPAWLSTPDHFELMASEEPYYYLAGRLINQDLVDVSGCLNGGLLPNGYADVCGLEKARPIITDWQNQFDQKIIDVGKATGVPGQLMKNLFAQESQFWPGMYRVPYEYGLGQITEQGADAIMIWNTAFFQQFCPLVLSESACAGGYLSLGVDDQAILRGALALQAKADCDDCPIGINLNDTPFTVSLFANTLVANCAQVSRTIYTATNQMAGRVATYEDLWKLTIANYHAGPGCVSYAIHQAWQAVDSLSWPQVSTYFTDPCRGVVPYVDQITR